MGLAAFLLLVGFACRELLRFQASASAPDSLSSDVEAWFFEPTDTSPAVVLAFSAWLLWRRRRRLAALWGHPGPAALTGALWLAAAGAFAWAVRSQAPDLQALALIPLLLGAANLLGGLAAMRVAALPAAVLVFAMPIPAPLQSDILWRLQVGTAAYTDLLLRILGFSPVLAGDLLFFRNEVFAIIESCAGLRSIETLSMLAVLMADLFGRRGAHAVLLLVAAPFVAFAINGLRAVGLIFNPHADIAAIHNLQGILMLLVGVLLLYAWDTALARLLPPAGRISAVERRARQRAKDTPPARPAAAAAALVACGAVLVALSALPPFTPPALAIHRPGQTLPQELDGWRSSAVDTDWAFLGAARFGQAIERRFTREGASVDVFLGQARLGARLTTYRSPKTGVPGSGWSVERKTGAELAGREVTLRVVRQGQRRMLVAHWYEGSPGLAAESARALLALDAGPFRRRRAPVAVRLATPLLEVDTKRAEARLESFATLLDPFLREMTTTAPADT